MFRTFYSYFRAKKERRDPLHIEKTETTLRHILSTRCSMARYGDGELGLMSSDDSHIAFQRNSAAIKKRLWEVMMSSLPPEQFIIALPCAMYYPEGSLARERKFWRKFLVKFCNNILPIIGRNRKFYDSLCSRPLTTYGKEVARNVFALWKQIWDGRPLLIVEGEKTRMGIGNDMLDNAGSISRILIPAVNAFEKYDEVMEAIVRHHKEGQLVLLAAGPTATVLAYDLARRGIQAIDSGHLDIQYCLYQDGGAPVMRSVQGKYVNECNGYTEGELSGFDAYQASIVERIE